MNALALASLFLIGSFAVAMVLIPVLDNRYRRTIDAWVKDRARSVRPGTETGADHG